MALRTKIEELLYTCKNEYKVSKYLIEEAEEEHRRAEKERDAFKAEVERLTLQIECDERDPAHANCRNVEAQLEAQRDCEEKERERLYRRVEELEVGLRGARDVLMMNAHSTRPCQCDPICRAVDALDVLLSPPPAPQPSEPEGPSRLCWVYVTPDSVCPHSLPCPVHGSAAMKPEYVPRRKG